MHRRCRVELLGGLRVFLDDQVLPRAATRKGDALLAYIAYHLDQMHPREVLADLFWPDVDPEAGQTSLNNALSSLRRQLEPPGITKGSILKGDRQGVGLNPQAVTTDIDEFKILLKPAPCAASPGERAQQLSDAIDLYHGELLPGFYDEWVITERQQLAVVYVEALDRLIDELTQIQEYQAALEYAHRAVTMDPLREDAHLRVIRLYAALNQPAAALKQYRELADLLQEQLGATPSGALRQFVRDIAQRSATAVQPLPVQESDRTPTRIDGRKAPLLHTVTFLATDVDELGALPGQRDDSVRDCRSEILRAGFSDHGGELLREAGASFLVAFTASSQALACAVACRRALVTSPTEEGPGVAIRMALHTGDVTRIGGSYDGSALNQVSRMVAAAHGGQVLCSQTTAELLRRDLPTDVLLADLGLYRLRGVSGPERIFQVVHPDPPREFPPLRTDVGYQSRLPVLMTRFFGREAEIARLLQMLRSGETRLLTLTGPGGAGKTRLSLEVAHRLLDAFSGAIWFAPLADLSDARRIAQATADAIGLSRSPVLEPLEQVVEALGRQPSLLVLDNMEQMADEGGGIIQTLLERVPTLTCFLTSRQVLALTDEREFPLAPLLTPEGANTPEALTRYDSVRLFVDRAQAARPDFQVTHQNAPAVAELCNRLEGIPLAIELAAARAQTLTPRQMLAQMEHRFDLLVSRKRDIEARHRTLRAAIDWSYRLLLPEIQRFFARLSIFRGGWTAEAAEAVCEELQASDYLLSLRDCSLILAGESDMAGDMPPRFRMLETLREYAREMLTSGDQSTLERRHAEFFQQFAAQADAGIRGPLPTYWLDRLEMEHDNFRAALVWARAGDPDVGLRLAASLPLFWEIRGHWREGYLWLTDLLERNDNGDVVLRAKALLHKSNLAHTQTNFADARIALNESYCLFETLGDRRALARVLNNLGGIATGQADYSEARRCHSKSLAIKQELGDRLGSAMSHLNIGYAAYLQDDLPTARSYLEIALATLRETTEKRQLASVLNNLGGVTRREGDYQAARALLEESLNLRREIGDQRNLPYSLEEFAYLAAAQEKPTRATQLLAAADTLRVGMRCPLFPSEQEHRSGFEALLRRELGEAGFQAEWQRGQFLTAEQAISLAYEEQNT